MKTGRVSVPGKIVKMLLSDDQFYREVASSKKISLQNFPKYDQWTDELGFNMEFALAGFSKDDVSVEVFGNILTISSVRVEHPPDDVRDFNDNVGEDDDVEEPKVRINRGIIVRGIARRSFVTDFLISPEFNLDSITATMGDGLLKITIPKLDLVEPRTIVVSNK